MCSQPAAPGGGGTGNWLHTGGQALSVSRRPHFLRTAEVAWALAWARAIVQKLTFTGSVVRGLYRCTRTAGYMFRWDILGAWPQAAGAPGGGRQNRSRGLVACPPGGVYSPYETGGGPQNIAVHCWGLEHRVN